MWVTQFYNLLLKPFDLLPDVWGLVLISAGAGLLLLLIYRYTSNQEGIRRAKRKLQAHLLEIVLYRHDLNLLLRAEKKLLASNLVYLRYALVPLMVAILFLVPLFGRMNLRYGYRPLRPGESTLVTAQLRPGGSGKLQDVSLEVPSGVELEAVVHIPSLQQVSWRVRGKETGRHLLKVMVQGQRVGKELVVGEGPSPLSLKRVGKGLGDLLFHSAETVLPRESAVETVSIAYQPIKLQVGTWQLHWVVIFLLVSMVVAFSMKGPLGIQV